MTKIQKIWLWIFIAMFAIPEILWSPIANFLYTFWKNGNVPTILRNNFLMHPDFRRLAIAIIFLQSLGALLSSFLVYKSSIKATTRLILSFLLLLFFVLSFGAFLILILTANISFP